MKQARHFTKVYAKPRQPLSFRPFMHALDEIIIADVVFALTGQEKKGIDRQEHILCDVIDEH